MPVRRFLRNSQSNLVAYIILNLYNIRMVISLARSNKKTHKKENPYKHRKVKNALKHEHLPKYMWTQPKFSEEIKRINPNIDITKIPLNVMRELFLLCQEEHHIDEYKSIYFFFLNKEYIRTLTQKDVDELSKVHLGRVKQGKGKDEYNKKEIERCREVLPLKWRYRNEFKY